MEPTLNILIENITKQKQNTHTHTHWTKYVLNAFILRVAIFYLSFICWKISMSTRHIPFNRVQSHFGTGFNPPLSCRTSTKSKDFKQSDSLKRDADVDVESSEFQIIECSIHWTNWEVKTANAGYLAKAINHRCGHRLFHTQTFTTEQKQWQNEVDRGNKNI